MQIRLRNHIGRTSLQRQIVRLDPKDLGSYILASVTDKDVIGTVAQSVPNNYYGLVNLINTFAPPTRIVTSDTTEQASDYTIMCDSDTDMIVYLLPASKTNRVIEISNIGAGSVTVVTHGDPSDPSSLDTIDGETTQIVSTNGSMSIKDYGIGTWKIRFFYEYTP